MLENSHAFSGFTVNDLVAAKVFYSDILGLVVREDEMGLTLKLAGNREVFVYEKSNHEPANYTVLNFPVIDITSTVKELNAKNVAFERYTNLPAEQDETGILRGLQVGMGPDIAWFKDPAGNILSVLQQS